MKIVSFIILSLLSMPILAKDSAQIHALIQKSLYSCGERIWPNLDWKSFEINLVSQTDAVQIVDDKLVSLSPEKANLNSKFRFEKNGITLNLDYFQSPQVAFEFLVHELFHSVGQKNLHALPSNQQDIFPASHYPRLEREELAQALQNFLIGEDHSLVKSATWFYRHLEHKEDLSADLIEGSAEYVEAIASGLSKLGCSVSETKLIEYASQRVSENGMAFDKSLEHYRIGALSFLAARKNKISLAQIFENNTHPLLSVVNKSLIDPTITSDTLLDHSAEMITELSNRRNKEVIDQINTGKHFAFIAFSQLTGSFEHRGSFNADGITYYEELTVRTKSGLIINGHGIQGTQCGEKGFLVNVEAEFKTKKSRYFSVI